MTSFTIFPAIDLRKGQVVRLKEGDPNRQTSYSSLPAQVAQQWVNAGARWLHVVNLDGAFEEAENKNQAALEAILLVTKQANVPVQVGGGIRTLDDIQRLLDLGISRAILGTVAVNNPEIVEKAVRKFGVEAIAVSIDARDGFVRTRGWQDATRLSAVKFAHDLAKRGLRWLVFTDIARDGLQTGLNIPATQKIAEQSGLNVIASGGVHNWDDITASAQANLSGAIVGRALYEGQFDPKELFSYQGDK